VNLLLDTQTLVWWHEGSRRLGPRARAAIERPTAAVLVSAASGWEIAIKLGTGRLQLRQPPEIWMAKALESSGFGTLHITMQQALAVAALPHHHADPVDRLLIVQAQLEGLTIVTSDSAFDDYDVRILDARA
jgi:PIN domain nuclease of toxin-antitoxin system